jgi:hypothetical protein
MYHIDTRLSFCFYEYCLSIVIISHVWDVTVILCFCGAIGDSTLFTLAIPWINGVGLVHTNVGQKELKSNIFRLSLLSDNK